MTSKILLVEDDPNFRAVLALALELEGYLVRQAPSGQSALELLDREIPDIIISDLEMNGMDGGTLCKRTRARAQLSSIPFVILSAFVNPGENCALIDLPADRCLSKQIPIAELTRLIRELLDGSAPASPAGMD
jgi:two-component system response regulator MprA